MTNRTLDIELGGVAAHSDAARDQKFPTFDRAHAPTFALRALPD